MPVARGGQLSSLEQEDGKENEENFTSGKIRRVALKDLSDDGYNSQFEQTKKRLDQDFSFWRHPECVHPIPRCFPELKRNNQSPEGYQAERLVFNLFTTLTNIGCILIHGRPFKKNKQRTAEVDFVVVAPNHCIILIEVKSSSNERQLGSLLKKAINQIKNKVKPGIEREIEERYGKTVNISTIDCVMFPNMEVSTEEVDAILKQESLPADDFVIASKIICAVPENFKNWFLEQCYKKMEDSEANCEEMYKSTIVSLVGKRFTEEILNDAIKQTSTNIQKQVERRELELTAEQKDCLECIHPTMVIYGLAGSGKTQILLMKVQRILDHDDLIGKTLIICYNVWLCKYIKSQVDSEYVDVYNIFTQYSSFIKHESKCNCQKKFFGRHFIGDVDPDCLVLKKRYRHIFVDEAEDINFGAFQILDLIQDQPKNKEINFRWFFADPNQNFEDISTTYDQIEKKHYFSKIVRTTSNVFDIVSKNVLFANWPKDKSVRLDHGIAGPSIEWIELKYIGGEHIAEKIYSKCLVPLFIERKLKIKLKTYGNVVILVGCNEPYVYMEFRNKLKDLCRGKVNVKNRHPFRDDELPTVRIATVSEFKGFEADVVIVILDCYCLVQSSFLYTAASRCSCQLFVITTSDIMGKVNGPSVSPNHRNLSRKIFKDLMVKFNGHPLKVLVCEAFNTVVGSCEKELKEICICTGRIKTITDSKIGHTCDEDYKMFLENRVYPFIYLLGMDQPDENVFKDLQKHFLNLLQGNNFDSKSCNEERKLKPVKEHDQKEEKAIEKMRYWHRIMDFNKVVPSNLMAISVTLEQVECAESMLNQLVINSPSQHDLDLVLYMKLFQLIKLDHFFGEILIFHDNKISNNKTIMFHQALLQWKSYIGYIDIENFPNKVFAAVVRDDETVEYYEQRQKKVYKFRHIFMFDSENLEKHWNQLFDKIQTNSTTENRLWIFKNTEQSQNKDQPCFYNNFTIKNLNGYRRASRTQPKSTIADNPCVHKHSSDNEVYGDHYLNYRQRRKLNENNLLPLY
ncbi:hypothetical protein GQR58_020956 [Nymphon striatum]|nr:hypothetical protein GQR58_020956 [Nymphon striatum]